MNRIILITNYVLFSCFVFCVNAGIESDAKFDNTIDKYINVFSFANTDQDKSGWSYWFVLEQSTETGMNLQMFYLDKEIENHPPHRHPEKEIYYIVEGQAEVFLADETRVIGPNTSLCCPPDMLHGIKRADDKPLKYLVIKDGTSAVASYDVNNNQLKPTIDKCITPFSVDKADIARTGWFFWFEPKVPKRGINLKMSYVDKLTGTHEPHQHAGEEILFMLDGQAEITIDGETKVVEPYTSIYYYSYSLHCIKRVNDQPIRYLVINP